MRTVSETPERQVTLRAGPRMPVTWCRPCTPMSSRGPPPSWKNQVGSASRYWKYSGPPCEERQRTRDTFPSAPLCTRRRISCTSGRSMWMGETLIFSPRREASSMRVVASSTVVANGFWE